MKEQKNLKRFGALAIAVALIAISNAYLTSADQKEVIEKGPKFQMEIRAEMQEKMHEIHEQMTEVMKNGDYQDWYDLVTQSGKTPQSLDVITKENFSKFAQMWNLKEESHQLMNQARVKMQESRKIAQQLGLKTPDDRPDKFNIPKGVGAGKFMKRGYDSQE